MFQTRFFNTLIAVALIGAGVFALTQIMRPAAATLGKASAAAQTIYHASEQDRGAAPDLSVASPPERSALAARAAAYLRRRNHIPAVRSGLFQMSPYQRSEWLGSDW